MIFAPARMTSVQTLGHELPIAARGVLGRKLDIVQMLARARDRPGGRVEHVLAGHVELVLEMDIRSRDEDMDTGTGRLVHRLERLVNVLLAGAREAQYHGFGHGLGDALHGLEVAGRGRCEAGLDNIDVEPFELARDRDLLLDVHGCAGRLLAVAQRGVEDPDVVAVVGRGAVRVSHSFHLSSSLRPLAGRRTARKRKRLERSAWPAPEALIAKL